MTNKTPRPLACIVLAAGKGTRMKSALPKVMHKIVGEPMLGHVLRAVAPLNPARIVVVTGPGMETVAEYARPYQTVVQQQQRGTADAVRAAEGILRGFDGDVLVLYGDMPLIRAESLTRLVNARREGNHAVAMLGMRPKDPGAYGRFVMGPQGLERIVEALDATEEERKIGLVNAGPLAADGAALFDLLDRIGDDNAKGEFYLTDIVAVARAAGRSCGMAEADEAEAYGVNSRAEQSIAEAVMQQRLRDVAMAGGATLIDPATTYFGLDTKLGRDVMVEPNVVFGPGVIVGDNVTIRAFCHIEGATIASGAIVGPFARIRPNSDIGENAHIGNFVELKNTVLGQGAKANHFAYLGDTEIGASANIGAGTIVCNYDGFAKHRTTIGQGSFVGSNSTLVAPVTIGEGALVAAGSVVTEDVPQDALAVGRARQVNKEGRAAAFRAAKRKEKATA